MGEDYQTADISRTMSKVSIRFYNDREVRAIWSDSEHKWYFSATDIVRAINDEPDYTKAGNYWRWLKKKLTAEGIEVVSSTHDFKFEAPDGKKRKADVLLDLIFKKRLQQCVDWSKIDKNDYLQAMRQSPIDDTAIRNLLRNAITDRITDREIFLKGIDYSYYYEQED